MDEQELIQAAQQHEQRELEKAMLAYLKERVVVLQVELVKRDQRIAELEVQGDAIDA